MVNASLHVQILSNLFTKIVRQVKTGIAIESSGVSPSVLVRLSLVVDNTVVLITLSV